MTSAAPAGWSSGGNFDAALYRDFVVDAIAAVRYLASREDIDSDRIGLFGISESGWLTPEIAAVSHGVAFIVNRVGPPLSWIETVLWEARNEFLSEGAAEADLDMLLALTPLAKVGLFASRGGRSGACRGPGA